MKNQLALSMAFGLILYFSLLPVTLADSPDIETSGVEEINYTSATLKGWVDPNGVNNVNVSFSYGETVGSNEVFVKTVQDVESFSKTVTDLKNSTDYEFKAVAKWNDSNETEGDVLDFTTSSYPKVETVNTTEVTHRSAVLNGRLTEIGAEDEVTAYFKWKKDGGTWQNTSEQDIDEEGSFKEKIEDLSCDESYHFKAVIQWSGENITIGSEKTFETKPEIYVKTLQPDDITTDSATLKAELLGNETKVEEGSANVSIEYWATGQDPEETDIETMDSLNEFSESVTDLSSSTTYTAQAKVESSIGQYKGNRVNFLVAPEFNLTDLEVDPSEVYPDEEFDVTVDLENNGDVDYEYEVRFYVDDDKEETKTVEVSSDSTETAETSLSIGSSGEYDIEVKVFEKSVDTEMEISEEPSVQTSFPEEVGADYAKLKGEVTDIGLEDEVTVFFYYGEEDSDEEYWGSTTKKELDSEGYFYGEIPIEEDVEYRYKAAIEWNDEESEGDTRSLEPDSCEYEDWENKTCGGWECDDNEIFQEKECTSDSPSFCESKREKCLEAENYCGVPNVSLELDKKTINVVQGKWKLNSITVENTGTKDLKNVGIDIEAEVPGNWFEKVRSNVNIAQKKSKDLKINFTPSSGAPVDNYKINYTVNYGTGNETKKYGELWVQPAEEKRNKISTKYNNESQTIEDIEKKVTELDQKTNVSHIKEDISEFKELMTEAEKAMGKEDYVTAQEKINKAESLRSNIENDVKKVEEKLKFPWFWVGVGIIVIIIAGLFIYLLLPPVEDYRSTKSYKPPGKESVKEKVKESLKSIKEKIFGEKEEGYTYNG